VELKVLLPPDHSPFRFKTCVPPPVALKVDFLQHSDACLVFCLFECICI